MGFTRPARPVQTRTVVGTYLPAHLEPGALAGTYATTTALAAKADATALVAAKAAAPGRLVSVAAPVLTGNGAFDYFNADGTAATAWTATNGTLVAPVAAGTHAVALLKGVTIGDGVIRANVTNMADNGAEYAGVVLSSRNKNSFLVAVVVDALTTAGSRKAGLFTFTDNTVVNVSGWINLTDFMVDQIGGSPVFALELERKGKAINFRINAKTIYTTTTITPDHYKYAGGAGLFSSTNKQAVFRNISAHAYDNTTIRAGLSKVIALGTSITHGIGASGEAAKYRNLLQTALRTAYNPALTIVNGGFSGFTSTQLLGQLPGLLAANTDASAVLLETPVNDFKTVAVGGLTADATMLNMREMVRVVLDAGKTPILWTSANFNPAQITASLGGNDFTNSESIRKMVEVNQRVRELAAEMRIRLADVNHGYAGNVTTNFSDGLHPNDAGHALIRDVLLAAFTGTTVY